MKTHTEYNMEVEAIGSRQKSKSSSIPETYQKTRHYIFFQVIRRLIALSDTNKLKERSNIIFQVNEILPL